MKTRMYMVLALASAGAAATARADVVDLSTSTNGTINGALFERANFRPAGSGVLHSFVRLSSNDDTEQGYNTSGRPLPFDENNSPVFTHDLRISDLVTRTVDNTDYYEFLLDANQQASDSLISLDQLQIYTSNTGSQTTSNVASLGTLRYDMDAGGDNWVVIDSNLAPGSGEAGMRLLVPVADFAGATPDQYVYLFSRFGDHDNNNGGFEEWAVRGGATAIPLPGAGTMALAGMACLGARRRRLTRSTRPFGLRAQLDSEARVDAA